MSFSKLLFAKLATAGLLLVGCANRQAAGAASNTGYATTAPRTVIAQPGDYDDIYVTQSTPAAAPVNASADPSQPPALGYDTLSDGSQVQVVTYVHTYPDPIDSYPRVYWGGNWYYNVNGDFVFFSPAYGGWVYYWGPPAPLVACWNGYYPWAPYYWGVGFYGAGWYWGGVGYYGYHAYGVPVVDHHNAHHEHWANAGGDKGPVSPGAPSRPANPGGPAKATGPHRIKPTDAGQATGPHRTKPADAGQATGPHRANPQNGPARSPGLTNGPVASSAPARTQPVDGPSRTLASDRGPSRNLATKGAVGPARTAEPPARTPRADADRVTSSGPIRTIPVASTSPKRAPTRNNSSYVTSSGQRVTVIDPRNPSGSFAPARTPRAIGRVPSSGQPSRTMHDPFVASSAARPSWDPPSAPQRGTSPSSGPSRTNSWSSSSPGRTMPTAPPPSRAPSPSFSPPRQNAPSRSFSPPRQSAPSRSSGGGRRR